MIDAGESTTAFVRLVDRGDAAGDGARMPVAGAAPIQALRSGVMRIARVGRAASDRAEPIEADWCHPPPGGGSKSHRGAAPRTTHALTWRFFNRATDFQEWGHALRTAVTALFPNSFGARPGGRIHVQRAAQATAEPPPAGMSSRQGKAFAAAIKFRRRRGGEIAHR